MATFTEEFARMRQNFDQAQGSRRQLFEETRDRVQQMAHSVREQLVDFQQQLHETHEKTADMARRVRTELHEFRAELGRYGAELKAGGNIFRGRSMPR
jgi:tRNA U34 5-carboxymethylaminomethyl modifying GTPase MnmE/TrmE